MGYQKINYTVVVGKLYRYFCIKVRLIILLIIPILTFGQQAQQAQQAQQNGEAGVLLGTAISNTSYYDSFSLGFKADFFLLRSLKKHPKRTCEFRLGFEQLYKLHYTPNPYVKSSPSLSVLNFSLIYHLPLIIRDKYGFYLGLGPNLALVRDNYDLSIRAGAVINLKQKFEIYEKLWLQIDLSSFNQMDMVHLIYVRRPFLIFTGSINVGITFEL